MNTRTARTILIAILFNAILFNMISLTAHTEPQTVLPYVEAGISEREAATHLLERFAFGARPGDIDRVVEMGLAVWLEQQLSGNLPSPMLEGRLAEFQSLGMSARDIVNTYPRNGTVRSQAIRAGVLPKDYSKMDQSEIRKKLKAFSQEKGYLPQGQLNNELLSQKLLRGVYSENQLVEVLTDFWFNHFNVTIRDNQASLWVLSYERDAIRPHVLENFRDLLGATAKHPAMLYYLDNAQSTAPVTPRRRKVPQLARGTETGTEMKAEMGMEMTAPPKRSKRGINENYARELLELHTLGVDGGYTQKDVVEVARALTGWGVFPSGQGAKRIHSQMKRRPRAFVKEGEFLFRAGVHDTKAKTILGQKFPAGSNIKEGERVLDMITQHPSTAHHISHKLAVRFVSDNPPETLVNRLADTFLKTEGDVPALIRTIAASPEFWEAAKQHTKTKTPFGLVVSALRTLKADVKQTRPTLSWIARMGQPLYACQPPTGYQYHAEAWVNTGTLLSRMNFGLNLAARRIKGVRLDLSALKAEPQSETADAALNTYAALILPERDLTQTLQRLTPIVQEGLQKQKQSQKQKKQGETVARMVGVILGSPEFQRY